MRNLFQFLWRFNFFIYFIVLEIICITLIYRTSYYQKSALFSASNSITGRINEISTGITSYLVLSRENTQLRQENAHLRKYLTRYGVANPDTIPDSVLNFKFEYLAGKVISNSINNRNNYFMIDKGTRDGVTTDMGVISYSGVAGIIVAVSSKYSLAMSVLHKNARISGKFKNNNQLVNITWNGNNHRIGTVEDVPTYVVVTAGDTIVTSGRSHIFPEGIMIGTIREIDQNYDKPLISGTLDFSTDFNSLYGVYIIRNFDRQEQLFLESKVTDEQ